jgi:hypothetical protein
MLVVAACSGAEGSPDAEDEGDTAADIGVDVGAQAGSSCYSTPDCGAGLVCFAAPGNDYGPYQCTVPAKKGEACTQTSCKFGLLCDSTQKCITPKSSIGGGAAVTAKVTGAKSSFYGGTVLNNTSADLTVELWESNGHRKAFTGFAVTVAAGATSTQLGGVSLFGANELFLKVSPHVAGLSATTTSNGGYEQFTLTSTGGLTVVEFGCGLDAGPVTLNIANDTGSPINAEMIIDMPDGSRIHTGQMVTMPADSARHPYSVTIPGPGNDQEIFRVGFLGTFTGVGHEYCGGQPAGTTAGYITSS